ncbi:MAG: 3-hydroxybutyryl-CoA dehydrogenase [Chitinophagaceae bacterium]|jgi:3-hydroxybutyryl-CoA dehydrogenase|nr:3-hydroxybutyryl-CoA dehydrogenase [Chitinophagaceae bacterium]
MSSITTIVVCGAGTMGNGIAQVCASKGYQVVLFDLNEQVLETAKKTIQKNLDFLTSKGKLSSEEANTIHQRIHYTGSLTDCIGDLIIEAIVEKLEIKRSLFSQLMDQNKSTTIYCSNTSSLSIKAIANELPFENRLAGLHFFNPAPLMPLVEIVVAEKTDTTIIESLDAFTRSLGKTPVQCIDAPGFIVNHVARPYYIESLFLAEKTGVGFDLLDEVLESTGFKMGPFKLMDLIGNDINYAVSCSVYEQLGKPERLKPSDIQKEKVASGELGKKTGKGYYQY